MVRETSAKDSRNIVTFGEDPVRAAQPGLLLVRQLEDDGQMHNEVLLRVGPRGHHEVRSIQRACLDLDRPKFHTIYALPPR